MKKMLLIFFIALPLSLSAQSAELTPFGNWKTVDDETGRVKSIVEIFERDGKAYGTIKKLFRLPTEEQHPLCKECEGELKNKPILGMTILNNLEKDDDEWSGGTILDPKNGKTYKCYIQVENEGKKLKVRGYIGFSLLGRTQYWHRVTEDASEKPAEETKTEKK